MALLLGTVGAMAIAMGLALDWKSVASAEDHSPLWWVMGVAAALIVDALALWAILARITEFGFTPNRVAALGENLILLANLAGAAWLGHGLEAVRWATGDWLGTLMLAVAGLASSIVLAVERDGSRATDERPLGIIHPGRLEGGRGQIDRIGGWEPEIPTRTVQSLLLRARYPPDGVTAFIPDQ